METNIEPKIEKATPEQIALAKPLWTAIEQDRRERLAKLSAHVRRAFVEYAASEGERVSSWRIEAKSSWSYDPGKTEGKLDPAWSWMTDPEKCPRGDFVPIEPHEAAVIQRVTAVREALWGIGKQSTWHRAMLHDLILHVVSGGDVVGWHGCPSGGDGPTIAFGEFMRFAKRVAIALSVPVSEVVEMGVAE